MAQGLPWADDDYALNQQHSLSLQILEVQNQHWCPMLIYLLLSLFSNGRIMYIMVDLKDL